ncbi:MAG: peptidylprolyl isomerase [Gammaproteobacteria bacterium]|nr:peptidylprolyl isomerase [Gammaproteobacteria bacterium]
MNRFATFISLLLLLGCSDGSSDEKPKTMAGIIDAAGPADWREPNPEQTLYMLLESGTVVFELAPEFAPNTVENVLTLVANRYFDGLSINRVQENYVVQWGDPQAGTPQRRIHELGDTLTAEFYRDAQGLDFVTLESRDAYAEQVGFVSGFPAGNDGSRAWLTHCYAMLGVGRDIAADSGNGTELYVVIGHAPRHLDRNVTLIGRVIHGMELLTTLPRGGAQLGFYETAGERVPIQAIRMASDVPESQRIPVELLRTDTPTFQNLVESRRNRQEEWFVDPAGRIGICNVPLPARLIRPDDN